MWLLSSHRLLSLQQGLLRIMYALGTRICKGQTFGNRFTILLVFSKCLFLAGMVLPACAAEADLGESLSLRLAQCIWKVPEQPGRHSKTRPQQTNIKTFLVVVTVFICLFIKTNRTPFHAWKCSRENAESSCWRGLPGQVGSEEEAVSPVSARL